MTSNSTSKSDNSSRTPHGVRGLKSCVRESGRMPLGRTPHGVRGLKSEKKPAEIYLTRRTPHGVRGLKYLPRRADHTAINVAPLTGCVD